MAKCAYNARNTRARTKDVSIAKTQHDAHGVQLSRLYHDAGMGRASTDVRVIRYCVRTSLLSAKRRSAERVRRPVCSHRRASLSSGEKRETRDVVRQQTARHEKRVENGEHTRSFRSVMRFRRRTRRLPELRNKWRRRGSRAENVPSEWLPAVKRLPMRQKDTVQFGTLYLKIFFFFFVTIVTSM